MIIAYLVGISTHYEGEDIQIKFHVFRDQQRLMNENFFKEYRKPMIVEHVALLELLKKLEAFRGEEITVVINNASLYEQIRGTSTLQKREAMKMTAEVREKLQEFGNSIVIKDVSNDKLELKKWKEILEA